MECMCEQTRPRFILSSERVLGNGVRTHVNSKGKIPSIGKKLLPRGGSNPRRCIKQDSEPNTLLTSYSGPQLLNRVFDCKQFGREGGGGG